MMNINETARVLTYNVINEGGVNYDDLTFLLTRMTDQEGRETGQSVLKLYDSTDREQHSVDIQETTHRIVRDAVRECLNAVLLGK